MQKVSAKTDQIAQIITKRRREKQIKRSQMAKDMGLTLRTYSRKEAGNLSLDELNTILAILDLQLIIVAKEHIM